MDIKTLSRIGAALAALLLLTSVAAAQQAEVVANLGRIQGRVIVIEGVTQREVQGRQGLLLRQGDTVRTEEGAKATIKFRDGSEVRLFPKTNFLIQGAKESRAGDRSFKFDFRMKLGALWALLVPQRQPATIGTSTATIGIKGTTLRVVERDDKARVALTEGSVEVSNERGTIELEPGKRLTDFTRSDDLATKVQDIPLKLDMKSEKQQLQFSGNQPEEVFVTVQLIDLKTRRQVPRSGPVYFRSNYDGITYPPTAELDQRGFLRVPLQIAPPGAADSELNGNIYVWAVLDQEEADDTAEGRVLFTFPVSTAPERIRVESQTGEGRRAQ